MKIRPTSIRRFAFAALLFASAAPAQNLVVNPYFDDGLNGWDRFPPEQVTLNLTMDYADSDSLMRGSAAIAGGEISFAAQCVTVSESGQYVANAMVYSHCPGHRYYVFWSDDSCMAGSSYMMAESTVVDAWQQLSMAATRPPAGTTRAIVTLENPGTCTDSVYFDDFYLRTEEIFGNGFELGD
ncbi:MAG TPA: hypothetical protein VHW73_10540 [Rudaea sp.]|jgi:hypothetical protein|nr:hypothetical protein [Rudaea sp.]